ncbi:MAG: 5-(carboxyamino)imidazole ribonucleotide synthase [Lachnospiraceae bacterium]|jgi:5-(carboxyamino)imidazole ribonucleotide synthase
MKKIGIIGGGQLGKMMILDGKRLDTQFYVLDPTFYCPCHGISDLHMVAGFDDAESIRRLAVMTDVLTYEFEHISVEALRVVEKAGIPVYPGSRTLELIQNKYVQKSWLRSHGIPVPDFVEADSVESIREAGKAFGYPLMLKTCTGGYDGKGNYLIRKEQDVQEGFRALGAGKLPLMAEKLVPFTMEISVLACRGISGWKVVYPVAENHHVNSILDETIVPARISSATEQEAKAAAGRCLEAFGAVGMLCVEFFVLPDGHVLVNELAPRPHNSGHYTIEGCVTSQFEQHVRAITGMPPGSVRLIGPTVMKNIIGDHEGHAYVHGLAKAYENPDVKIHIYGKEEVRPGRKMGHITACCATVEEALRQVRAAHAAISFADEKEENE